MSAGTGMIWRAVGCTSNDSAAPAVTVWFVADSGVGADVKAAETLRRVLAREWSVAANEVQWTHLAMMGTFALRTRVLAAQFLTRFDENALPVFDCDQQLVLFDERVLSCVTRARRYASRNARLWTQRLRARAENSECLVRKDAIRRCVARLTDFERDRTPIVGVRIDAEGALIFQDRPQQRAVGI